MKRTKISYRFISVLLLFFAAVNSFGAGAPEQEYYQMKIYRISNKTQETMIDAYLKDAYLPALHRAGIPVVGVFKPVEADTAYGKLVYVFIPFKTVEQFTKLPDLLLKDKVYAEAGKAFIDANYNHPPYDRCENIFMKAFMNMPQFATPKFTTSPSERIYELRSYESATEAKAAKKIEMFNTGGEIDLFRKLAFNPVFWGEVLIGSHMPNLMYMTTFQDMKKHDELWSAFGKSEEWKKMSGLEEYKNTIIKPKPYLLHPTDYSDF
jgi:hypothetical protein